MLEQIWQYIVAGAAAIIWFVRLEGQTKANAAEIEVVRARTAAVEARALAELAAMEKRMLEQRREDMEVSRESRQEVKDALADLRTDVKRILERMGERT